jgi:hypothetical protein
MLSPHYSAGRDRRVRRPRLPKSSNLEATNPMRLSHLTLCLEGVYGMGDV